MQDATQDLPAVDIDDLDDPDPMPGIIAVIGELKPGAIIREEGMAHLFKRHVASVKRAVERGELPPPCRLFGSNIWTIGALIKHIEARLAEAAKEAERISQAVARLSPGV